MLVRTEVKREEMREAFRMNLTPKFWLKAIFSNVRTLIYLGIAVALIVQILMKGGGKAEWEHVGLILALAVLFIGLYLFRLSRSIHKTAGTVNAACCEMLLDAHGLTSKSSSGASIFTPWADFNRWKEGKSVFTVGDKKEFRTIPKGSMSEPEIAEVRGILQSQIRIA